MAKRFNNKYRVDSVRLQKWHYSWKGSYFITICTKNRNHYFGKIQDGKMILSRAGIIANVFWHEIKNHAKHIELGEFIIMPDHIHGIITITKSIESENLEYSKEDSIQDSMVQPRHALAQRKDSSENSSQDSQDSLEIEISDLSEILSKDKDEIIPGKSRFQNQGKNTISSMIGGYKAAVTKHCNRMEIPFGWQPSFHEHIIRNDWAFNNISRYIRNNPQKWEENKNS